MRIEREPCPNCNSPLTSAPRRTTMPNGMVVLKRKCSICKLEWTVGATTDRIKELESRRQKILEAYERETIKYGSPRTKTKQALSDILYALSQEQERYGLNASNPRY
jgi:hypothetical protein